MGIILQTAHIYNRLTRRLGVECIAWGLIVDMKIEIHRVSCRACDEIFCGRTQKEANDKHRQHIKKCPLLTALIKVERFRRKAEKILGRKVTFLEAAKLLGVKK